uniref:Reverse transcriptase domain-containing protein n=1 Tax=Tanacetum cinerariifolium TaxID=118510 RepID=A0A6L2KSV3_TANCI|nr:reverse transcriptase domain-containing protein [Tanacetum cinerariifolium]
MSWNDFKFMMIEEFYPSHEMQKLETGLWNHIMVKAGYAAYTDKFHELARLVLHLVTPESRKIKRNGSIKKIEKRENVEEPSKYKNGRDDNKRTRIVLGFLIHPIVRACYECGSTDHVRPACPRLNRAQGPGGNHPNQVVTNNGGQGCRNQGDQARGREFMLGAEEARQDSNIVTGFRYEIEIASGQLVEIDKVIKDCKLEIKGHVFDIDLMPFWYGSFDGIIAQIELILGAVPPVMRRG